ncbi:MAG: cytidine deaminase [Blastocatellales bacterium]
MKTRIEELIKVARSARERAYAPYSGFRVGAAVETADGKVYAGCNVENSSYGLTVCAERTALAKAVSEGERHFVRIVVIAETKIPVPPCGACRQVILELCGKDVEVVLANIDGQRVVTDISSLLPMPFDKSLL